MKPASFRLIDILCSQLLQAKLEPVRVDKLIADGIRQRVVDKDTLPLIIQKAAVGKGEWCLALRVLQSKHLDTHRIRRDDTIWSIIDKGLPNNDASKKAAQVALQKIYGARFKKAKSPRSIR
ncbi:unspecified product [Leptomonas pyrrhocoris]|uniref:Unspecified product n=1 Tax=Leptomonas pyrrhocoris TaxID=157538 RepID=A0A0M9G2Z2_LEPPY|nr:unspecified product [Leptomonas pyrrhocoris]KPA81167.1 unspecified product [Leptomonas pyrrhocoris]|eukprot:XP_015659606.1 unspecified product [Leptomonas pyrrhocoris]